MSQEDPKKKPIDLLFALEEERLKRRRDALDKKFQMTIQHIDEVVKANEECYQAKRSIAETAKGNPPPVPPPPPVAAPLKTPDPPSAPPPAAPPTPAVPGMLRSPWPRVTPLPRPLVKQRIPSSTIPVAKPKAKSKRKKK